ncbi:IS110 family transposase (plasmid) [Halobiforma lacisalsi AJ5]|uniref:Transposase n=1 Tax=Natronobacterium lacisalsi AJ5 TaxID=358396 RepID=M0LW37_NATLA|nr:IS110 family transposase [Halobiforma lacisalsi AJ5]EMA37373.1 transposase [Halobiforma lacisalsi AJ5]
MTRLYALKSTSGVVTGRRPLTRDAKAYFTAEETHNLNIPFGESHPFRGGRRSIVQAAHNAVHNSNDEYLSRFYDRLARWKNSQKAIVATARKMLVSIYHMLDRGEVYDPPGVSA